MTKINWHHFFIYIIPFFIIQLSKSQNSCSWIYQDIEEDGYEIVDDEITLLYCENSTDTIWAPEEYIDATWEYETNNGGECEDWDWVGNQFFLSIDSNDPCLEGLSQVTVTFTGFLAEDTDPDICVFNIQFDETPNPVILAGNFNTDEQIVLCEQNLIELEASGLGSGFDNGTTSIQWYLNNELIEPTPNPSNFLDIQTTNYIVNDENTFYFTVSNHCTELNGSDEESNWLTITIYEGYEECESCQWEPFTRKEWIDEDGIGTTNNEFYIFTPNDDGFSDYFPEPGMNEENRNFENDDKFWPTCDATIYQLTIFNRLGREIWQSEYNNHPWDGKLQNGKECKEGPYFYKIEYILHPLLEEINSITELPNNATIINTGSVFLHR
ncbi:MAG: hypothetical protein CMP62_01080 [Flavobacteriales bacterium]|nr:hypothetical protein [Flavobacteriales bacterium]|tara:strand:+ start:14291 stop:15439 length:1149 start_codon:yes stop_codon:yes gene_type:complete